MHWSAPTFLEKALSRHCSTQDEKTGRFFMAACFLRAGG